MKSRARLEAQSLVNATECNLCGATKRLHVHHVDHNALNNALENLEVLCFECHMAHHRMFGY